MIQRVSTDYVRMNPKVGLVFYWFWEVYRGYIRFICEQGLFGGVYRN